MKASNLVGALVLSLGVVASAEAASIQFIDTFTPGSPVALDAEGDFFEFTHDLTLPANSTNSLQTFVDSVVSPGDDYDNTTDTLTSGVLTLSFGSSPLTPPSSNGQFDLLLSNSLLTGSPYTFQATMPGLSFNVNLINDAGILTVKIERTNAAGSVNFTQSVLNVQGTRGVDEPQPMDPVPEPGSMILLGTGLAGLVAYRMRRRKA